MSNAKWAIPLAEAPTPENALLHFLAQERAWELDADFYHDLQEFLARPPLTVGLFVFSYSTTAALKERTFRKVWPHPKKDNFSFKWDEFHATLPAQLTDTLTSWQLNGEHGFWFAFNGRKNQSILLVLVEQGSSFPAALRSVLKTFVGSTFEALDKWKNMKRMLSLAYVDDVSGLYNQRKLFEDINEIVRRAQAHHTEFAVFFIDIDYFKNVNDNYGHLAGTRILAQLGLSLKRGLRETDLAYRYGGDEFVIILTDTDLAYARAVGERLLKEISQQEFLLDEGQTKISVSIGIATFPQDALDATEIIRLADRMMYEAKGRGRGQVCAAFEMLQAHNPEPER